MNVKFYDTIKLVVGWLHYCLPIIETANVLHSMTKNCDKLIFTIFYNITVILLYVTILLHVTI